jgi:hypothetical protein
VLHTLVLLVILLGGAGLMYFSAGELRAADHPNRTGLYLSTAIWEWMLTAYVLWGVRRRGTPLEAVTGPSWKSFLEFARDFGIAVSFWFVALMVLGATALALHFRGSKASVGFLAPHGWMEVGLWILVCVTAGFCEERECGCGSGSVGAGVRRVPHLSGREAGDCDYGVWIDVWDSGAVAKEFATGDDDARAARYG